MMKQPTVFLNGLFRPLSAARISVLDRGFNYGDGLFETMRSYNGRVFRLDAHLERMALSLDLIYLDVPMTVQEMKTAVHATVKRNEQTDCMIRMTISRGEQTSGFHIDPDAPPTLVVIIKALEALPQEWYEEGIKISLYPGTAQMIGGLDRQIKSCNFLSNIILREQAHRDKSLEGIMLDNKGRVTEGTTSNVFIVKGETLITPKINRNILPGITRQAVLEIATRNNLSISLQAISAENIYNAEEVFITNSRIEILPVRIADNKTIGNGKPGPITRFLHKEFLKSVEGVN